MALRIEEQERGDACVSPLSRSGMVPGDGQGRLFYGASVMPGLSLSDLENALDHRLTIKRSYFSATQVDALLSQVAEDHDAARLPVVSVMSRTWAQVAAGDYDGWLNDLLIAWSLAGRWPRCRSTTNPRTTSADPGMAAADWACVQERAITAARRTITIPPILMACGRSLAGAVEIPMSGGFRRHRDGDRHLQLVVTLERRRAYHLRGRDGTGAQLRGPRRCSWPSTGCRTT